MRNKSYCAEKRGLSIVQVIHDAPGGARNYHAKYFLGTVRRSTSVGTARRPLPTGTGSPRGTTNRTNHTNEEDASPLVFPFFPLGRTYSCNSCHSWFPFSAFTIPTSRALQSARGTQGMAQVLGTGSIAPFADFLCALRDLGG
jgi:hypothetical protein